MKVQFRDVLTRMASLRTEYDLLTKEIARAIEVCCFDKFHALTRERDIVLQKQTSLYNRAHEGLMASRDYRRNDQRFESLSSFFVD
jgi:hypothetical protein